MNKQPTDMKSKIKKKTELIVVMPDNSDQELFVAEGDFEIVKALVANSANFVEVAIVDQYAIWTILSRLEIMGGLFACQDVTMGYKEQKHQEHFNPVVLHYTTKGEQELAKSD